MNRAVVLPFTDLQLPLCVLLPDGPVSPDAIRIQLAKILKSEGFVRAERMKRFLRFVVEESLAGRASQLCEYAIGVAVFQRDESFEPGLDPIVRNEARRLRQKLLEYYERSQGVPDPSQVTIELPKGGYAPVFNLSPRHKTSKSGGRYRFTVKLTRVADGVEIWATEHEFSLA